MNNSYDECRSLYRAARAEEHSTPADRHAVRVGLAASIAAGVHTATAGASAASMAGSGAGHAAASAISAKGIIQLILGGKFVSEVIIGVALGTAVSTTVLVVERTNFPATPAATSKITANPPPAQPRVIAPQAGDVNPPPQPELPQAAAIRVAAKPAKATSPSAPAAALAQAQPGETEVPKPSVEAAALPAQDGLVEETQALAQVQAALNRRDPTLAWSLLQHQDVQFASGQLGEERAAAKILTLCAAGRADLAGRARTSFLLRYPNSPLANRVKLGCDR